MKVVGRAAISTRPIYPFTQFTFTPAGATGTTGPTSDALTAAGGYNSVYPGVGTAYALTITNGIQYWTVPQSGNYTFTLAGAGTTVDGKSGFGWVFDEITNTYTLTRNDVVAILVGQPGGIYTTSGGSGGTYVAKVNGTNSLTGSLLLFAAGGGGGIGVAADFSLNAPATGATTGKTSQDTGVNRSLPGSGGNGASGWLQYTNTTPGGGGYLTSAGQGTSSTNQLAGSGFLQGGNGGAGTAASGGFGGGGAASDRAGGGGGGYSGGAGAGPANSGEGGGGGGSYNINNSGNAATGSATNSGAGYVIITKV